MSLPQRAPGSSGSLWYQEILDRIADQKKHVITFPSGGTIGGDALPWMHKIEAVALALDAKDRAATQAAIKALIADQPTTNLPYAISESLDHEIAARAFGLGLAPEAMQLLHYFRARSRTGYYSSSPFDRNYAEDRKLWERVTTEATTKTAKSAADAPRTLDALLPIFAAERAEISELDAGRVEADYKLRRDSSTRIYSGPYDQSISEYYFTLSGLIERLFIQIETCEQLLIGSAESQLEEGKGSAGLDAAKLAHARIAAEVAGVSRLSIATTRSEFHKTGSKHFDFFGGKAAKARAIGITFFDPSQIEGEEMQASYGEIMDARVAQLAFLERLYGVQKQGAKPTDEATSNAAAIKAMGGHLRLHSNEDWREFLSQKLKQMRKAGVSDADALDRMLDLIHGYFSAYTVHTPYNIEEGGDNYLSRSFPRTLSGQLLHDCGVYALRIVYMLSLIRKDLHLDIRFVVLPAHVGLILTGDASGTLPTYFVHNNSFTKMTPKELGNLRRDWLTHDPTGAALATPQKEDEEQFMGELAAALYSVVTAPFKLAKVPELAGGNAADLQAKYFKLYHDRAVSPVLQDEQGKTGIKDFELRYVRFHDQAEALNSRVKQFWNDTGPTLWNKHKARLLSALSALQSGTPRKNAYVAERDSYLDDLRKEFTPLNDERNRLLLEGIDIGAVIAKHPGLIAKGAHVSPMERGLVVLRSSEALDSLVNHMFDLEQEDDLTDPRKRDRLEPEFVKPDAKKWFRND